MKFILSALLLFIGSNAFSLTLSDMRTEILRNMRTTTSKYSASVLNSFINEEQRNIVNLTWSIERSTSVTLIANTTYYNLPNGFIAAEQVTFLDSNLKRDWLEEVSEKKLLQDMPDYERSSKGTPTEYFIRFSTSGGNKLEIAFNPIATTSVQVGTATVKYYKIADDLTSDTGVPFDGLRHLYPYHYAIVAGVTKRLKLIENRIDEYTLYDKMFQEYIVAMRSRLGERPNYSPGVQGALR